MSCEFEAMDYEGLLVRCSHRTWSRHIAFRHPEIEDQQAAVLATLNQPDLVYRIGEIPDRKLLYRRSVLSFPYEQDYLMVVVSYPPDSGSIAGVVTAYRKAHSDIGDRLIWSKLDITN